MNKIGIFYGSSTGNTESVAKLIADEFGADSVQLYDVASATASDVAGYDNLIFGTSTWGLGELQDDFGSFLDQLKEIDLDGKTVALFGCGDQESYSDTFVDGMGEVYEALCKKGCKMVGRTATEGYSFDASRSEVDGSFVGLAVDEDNQGDLTTDRVKNWVADLKAQFS